MAVNKVILYYHFVPVPDPESVMFWQRNLCQRLGLSGRIIISEHGINGTLGHDFRALKHYVRELRQHSLFRDTEMKWSEGRGNEFPRLSVKVRKELVTLSPDEQFDVFDAGVGLRPAAWHKLLTDNPDITLLDARNRYESEIGKFRGAITPDIESFREIKETLDTLDKSKPVATYCTGDVRCEYLSAYMKHVGFEEVYHLKGGIVKYGQQFKGNGLWDGTCYTFDGRQHIRFSPKMEDIAACGHCGDATSEILSCSSPTCIERVVMCTACQEACGHLCDACVAAGSERPSVQASGPQ